MKSKKKRSGKETVFGGILKTVVSMCVVVFLGAILIEKGMIPREWGGIIGGVALALGAYLGAVSLFDVVPKKWMASVIWAGGMLVVMLLLKFSCWGESPYLITVPVLGVLTGALGALVKKKGRTKYRVKGRK